MIRLRERARRAGRLFMWRAGAPPPHSFVIKGGSDARLDRLLEPQLAQHPGHSGVRLLDDGAEAFALRVLSAQLAVRSLDLQYYIWRGDLTGRYLAYEVLLAADRGVRIRMLLDDMDARSRDSVLMVLDQHPNIEIRLFNPFVARSGMLRTFAEVFARGSHLNRRMHSKAWIADCRIALVGGRNIGDEYFSASKALDFLDLDVLLAGAAVDATANAFDIYWNSSVSTPVHRLRRTSRSRVTLTAVRDDLQRSAHAAITSEYGRWLRHSSHEEALTRGVRELLWSAAVTVVVDDPRKAEPSHPVLEAGVLESLTNAIRHTRTELLLISPYFVPGATGAGVLRDLAFSGAQVSILTNSLAATDVAAVHSGYSRYRKALLRAGVKLFELKPAVSEASTSGRRIHLGSSRASLHTKAAAIDAQRMLIGSFNLDPRSAELNCEMGVWIADAELTQQLRDMFAASAGPSRSFAVQMDANGRTRWHDSDGAAERLHTRDPNASWQRRLLVWILQFLPIESQL